MVKIALLGPGEDRLSEHPIRAMLKPIFNPSIVNETSTEYLLNEGIELSIRYTNR
jgi:hypothetical protein